MDNFNEDILIICMISEMLSTTADMSEQRCFGKIIGVW